MRRGNRTTPAFQALTAVSLLIVACAGANAPIRVTHAPHVSSNIAPRETEMLLADVERDLLDLLESGQNASRGGLRRTVFTSVHVDGPVATIEGCGRFYDYLFPDQYTIDLVAVKHHEQWHMHSWHVRTDGLEGPPEPCTN